MAHVKSIADIERNAFELLDEVYGHGQGREIALKLIKGGRVFLPIQFGESLAFVPSKFIGYLSNTVAKHEAVKRDELRDGRETNAAIQKILGKNSPDAELELRLREYCASIGAELEDHKHSFWRIEGARRFTAPVGSAINDVQSSETTNDDPEYKRRMAGSYVRDDGVRRAVLKRANGACEYGATLAADKQCSTFLKRSNGEPYLEAHHVIKLSEQGKDKQSNVIALCANHHREAHFGRSWKSLQDEFSIIISKKMSH